MRGRQDAGWVVQVWLLSEHRHDPLGERVDVAVVEEDRG